MNRCAICDYTKENGSPLLNIPRDGRTIQWIDKYKEFQCSVCSDNIKKDLKTTQNEQEQMDRNKNPLP